MLAVALYMLKVTLISGILFGYYLLALKNERFHSWNRYYLVLSAVVSLLLPFAHWSPLFSAYRPAAVEVHGLSVFTLKAQAAGEAALASGGGGPEWPLVIYSLVCLFLLAGLARVLFVLFRRIRRGVKEEHRLFTLVADGGPDSPFSFFRYIFWNQATPLDSREGRHILRHELVHVQQKHSFDKLLLEAILVACWINPFFYLIRRELHTIHEFIADRKSCYPKGDPAASGNINPREYAALLVSQALGIRHTGVTSHFFQKQLTRRVRMLIRENKTRFSWLKRVMAIPLALCVMSFFLMLQSQARDKGVTLLPPISTPARIFHSIPALTAGKDATGEKKVRQDAQARQTRIAPPKKPSLASMIIKMLPDPDPRQELTADVGLRPAKVFTFVEDMPEFPGGTRALMAYLHDQVHYPEAARANGVQGTVVVQFIVHPDGKLSDITTVGPDHGDGLETEALRVVRDMPDWIPGRQQGVPVAVRYALPVRFLLTESPHGQQPPTVRSTPAPASSADHVFTFVEQMPAFPGGQAALRRYLRNHIRYPDKAREQGIQGTVVTHFIVNPDGSLSGIGTEGPEKGGGLEEEAIRVISQMPSWHPAIQNGRKVSVAYSLPIRFVLQ